MSPPYPPANPTKVTRLVDRSFCQVPQVRSSQVKPTSYAHRCTAVNSNEPEPDTEASNLPLRTTIAGHKFNNDKKKEKPKRRKKTGIATDRYMPGEEDNVKALINCVHRYHAFVSEYYLTASTTMN
jgi:hypothetical protein